MLVFSMTSRLSLEETQDSEKFLEECVQDPTLRDKLSILNRTFQNRRKVRVDELGIVEQFTVIHCLKQHL